MENLPRRGSRLLVRNISLVEKKDFLSSVPVHYRAIIRSNGREIENTRESGEGATEFHVGSMSAAAIP